MSPTGASSASTSPSRNTMAQSSPAKTAADTPAASEEPAILNLPVELQKMIVEYVSTY